MDRNSSAAINAGIFISVIGVFALMIMPIVPGVLIAQLGYAPDVAISVVTAEVGGGALASLLAIFWIGKINWRTAMLFAIAVVALGNAASVFVTDVGVLTGLRFAVGFFGQGTAFAIGIAMIGSTSDPDKNFGFVIAAQVAFGVVTLLTLQRFVDAFDSVGGVYVTLGALAVLGLPLIRNLPAGFEVVPEGHEQQSGGSLALPVTGLVVMLIWCCGLGAMWAFVSLIGEAGGLEPVLAQQALAISSGVAILGAFGAAALAGKGVNRFLPVTIALIVQMIMAWLLQNEMSWVELAFKASLFQIFWNMTGPFIMGAIAASDSRGNVAVLIPFVQTAGFAVGPEIAKGFMAEGTFLAANLTTIACCGIALVIFLPFAARLRSAGL